MNNYAWKPGTRTKAKPEVAGERLRQLLQTHGRLTAPIVLDDSRPADAPLHPEFEWDDWKAAEQHRLEQARHIMQALVLVDTEVSDKPIRAFVVVSDEEGNTYQDIAVAMADPEMRGQVLQRAMRELEVWGERYQQYEEFRPVLRGAAVVKKRIRK